MFRVQAWGKFYDKNSYVADKALALPARLRDVSSAQRSTPSNARLASGTALLGFLCVGKSTGWIQLPRPVALAGALDLGASSNQETIIPLVRYSTLPGGRHLERRAQ